MKVRDLDLSDNALNAEHQALGLPPVERALTQPVRSDPALRLAFWSVLLLLGGASAFLATRLVHGGDGSTATLLEAALANPAFWTAVAVGLVAQTVDGALGMAYGITSTSFLLATGTPPALASASVHIAEVFTTGVSGIAHLKFGNVDRRLFLSLLLPGIVGATAGAWLVSSVDGDAIRPFIAAYLLAMGLYVISKMWRRAHARRDAPRHVAKLGLAGGFVDAVGGGGWGPVVTTTLVGTGHDPRLTIGSVNLAEFFLTFVSAGVFTLLVGESPWLTVSGLVLGGVAAAPLAAMLTRRLHTRTLLGLVGTAIVLVSAFNLHRALG